MALVAELGTAKVYKIFKPTNFFADFLRFSTKKFDADFLLFQAITHLHFPVVLSLCDKMCKGKTKRPRSNSEVFLICRGNRTA
jgi:hypothetical protein